MMTPLIFSREIAGMTDKEDHGKDIKDAADMPESKGEKKGRRHLRPMYALAASILLVVMVGGNLVYQKLGKKEGITIILALDGEFQSLLLENSRVEWDSPERIQKFQTLLNAKGVKVNHLNGVVMASAYSQSKSFFKKEEDIVIRIEKGTAYIEVIEKDSEK